MKKCLLVLLLLVSVSLPAAPAKKVSSSYPINHLTPDYMITGGLGFAIAGAYAGFALQGGFLIGPFDKAPELFIGADVGLDIMSAFFTNLTIIHLHPTAIYRFKTGTKWIPYAGLSIGPSILAGAIGYVAFAFLPRGGVDYVVSNNIAINGDLKMGIVGIGGFYFKPTVNVVFYF